MADLALGEAGLAAIASSGPFIGAICALGGGVLAWTYQTGSARLGVVDLFACEIATLCRVGAVVDMVQRYVDSVPARSAGRAVAHRRRRDCPPIPAASPRRRAISRCSTLSVKDLQALEADVVKHVTAFYTYMKVMRDTLRRLAEINHPPQPGSQRRRLAPRDVQRYLHAVPRLRERRKAIKDLVEFEPTQAEDMITILLSELLAYGFLREQFTGDLRERRLAARDAALPTRHSRAVSPRHDRGKGPQWDAAQDIADEMMKRLAIACWSTRRRYARKALPVRRHSVPCHALFGSTLSADPTEGDGHEHGQR